VAQLKPAAWLLLPVTQAFSPTDSNALGMELIAAPGAQPTMRLPEEAAIRFACSSVQER